MTGKLPININHLLRQRPIEGERIEYKAGWNPQSVLHTICAFANDFHNIGGGYVVLGVEEQNGRPILPPKGIKPDAIDAIQNELLNLGQAVSRRYRNRRIGEFLKELDLAEARSTGVPKIFRAMRQNGSPEPIFESDDDRTWFRVRLPVHERASLAATEQDTGQDKSLKNKEKSQDTPQDTGQDTGQDTIHETIHVTEHVERLISILTGEMNRPQLQDILGISNRPHFVEAYLGPALKAGLIEMTLPDKPKSRKQQYRRTAQGEALAEQIKRKNAPT